MKDSYIWYWLFKKEGALIEVFRIPTGYFWGSDVLNSLAANREEYKKSSPKNYKIEPSRKNSNLLELAIFMRVMKTMVRS